ncbi:cAMP-regulated D2 protein [Aplysia californica]|uniref:Carboxylic ester hydrolase n=1 Tax=Aplysia californica TaxID=6500 RepID=A0ABM1A519_APLCA|nr:cAMP-regulated D2 protein [Aplysia californica]
MESKHFLSCLLTVAMVTMGVSSVVVETHWGAVRGIQTDTAQVFRGIPYAAPPVGELRWRPPQPAKPWSPLEYDATQESLGCPQVHCDDLTPTIACPTKTSEDCLLLDIYAPTHAKNGTDLAVLFFIHGGNFFFMAGSSPLFDGSVMAQKGNVIVVDINYRIGALGFLVTGQGAGDARGNYGILDQRLALEWVSKSIQAFGGDPNKVTIFGQSAGAQSVIQHLLSESSSSYFHNAIVESSPAGLPYKTYDEAFVLAGLFAEAVGCPIADLNCMRGKSAQEVAEAAYRTRKDVASAKFLELFEPYGPYVDGSEVKGQPVDMFTSGHFAKKPLILGTTREETVLYIYSSFNHSVDVQEFLVLIEAVRPSKGLEILEMYPPTGTPPDQREVLVNISTDLVFTCPTRNISRAVSTAAGAGTWLYLWDHAFSFPGWGHVTYCEGRVCHGSELPYVFATAYKGNFSFTPEETVLSNNVISYWSNFAWNGDPNKPRPTALYGDTNKPHPVVLVPDFRKDGKDDIKDTHVHQLVIRNGKGNLGREVESQRVNAGQVLDKSLRFHPKEGNHDSTFSGSLPAEDSASQEQLPNWPQFEPRSAWASMRFQTPESSIIQNYRKEFCDFWDSLGYGA